MASMWKFPRKMGFIPPSVTSPDGRHGARAASVVAAASVVGSTALAWAYLAYQSWAMRHMDVEDMAMPGAQEWGPLDLALVFTMWAVMMIGMMASSVCLVFLLFSCFLFVRFFCVSFV